MKGIAQTSACNSSGLNELESGRERLCWKITRRALVARLGNMMVMDAKGGSGERIAQTSDKRSPGLDEMAKKTNKKRATYRKKPKKSAYRSSKSLSITDKPLVACLDSDNVQSTQGELLELTLRR